MAACLEHVRGQSIGLADIQAVTHNAGICATKNTRARSRRRNCCGGNGTLSAWRKTGIGRFGPHHSGHSIRNSALDAEQRQAVRPYLAVRATVSPCFEAVPGTGKSYALRKYMVHCNETDMLSKLSHRNGNKSWTWNGMVFIAHKRSVPFSRAARWLGAAWCWSMRLANSGSKQMHQLLTFVRNSRWPGDSLRGHPPAWRGGSLRRVAGH